MPSLAGSVQPAGSPPSIAWLPPVGAMVSVGPPLRPSEPIRASSVWTSPAPVKAQLDSSTRL